MHATWCHLITLVDFACMEWPLRTVVFLPCYCLLLITVCRWMSHVYAVGVYLVRICFFAHDLLLIDCVAHDMLPTISLQTRVKPTPLLADSILVFWLVMMLVL